MYAPAAGLVSDALWSYSLKMWAIAAHYAKMAARVDTSVMIS
jgi:type IV secretory pathway TrbD component